MVLILDLSHIEASNFLLQPSSYSKIGLPKYFSFSTLLSKVERKIGNSRLSDFYSETTPPDKVEGVNYMLFNNKDGRFAWRPLQLIHPAFYVSLVKQITEEAQWQLITEQFKVFQSNPSIICCSIPRKSDDSSESDLASSVTQWWHDIEQKSIELALEYEYMLQTDITDCYGSIYTHSIPWALHTKQFAKEHKDDRSIIGNIIDTHLQHMSYGQTNGIPQGSVLMDFIAEIVLGYADLELTTLIGNDKSIDDYKIIRYRDDYRIFTNSSKVAHNIAKLLTEVLVDLGMRLNATKTLASGNVIRDSIKSDKLYTIENGKFMNSNINLQQELLLIHSLSEKYPNSGSISKALDRYYSKLKKLNEVDSVMVLISILVDIMYKNPRTYSVSTAILSKLLSFIEKDEKSSILSQVERKFNSIPNVSFIKIWLQRLTLKLDRTIVYDEALCYKVNDKKINIWNSNWLKDSLKRIVDNTSIIDEEVISEMDEVISSEEVRLYEDDNPSP